MGLSFQGLSVIGVQQIDRVVEVVEEALKGKSPLGRMFSGVRASVTFLQCASCIRTLPGV